MLNALAFQVVRFEAHRAVVILILAVKISVFASAPAAEKIFHFSLSQISCNYQFESRSRTKRDLKGTMQQSYLAGPELSPSLYRQVLPSQNFQGNNFILSLMSELQLNLVVTMDCGMVFEK